LPTEQRFEEFYIAVNARDGRGRVVWSKPVRAACG
jgi:hypothetical protein